MVIYYQVERHPNVLHLPAPHIWQLDPSSVLNEQDGADETLIVTLEVHVRRDLGDDEILGLTRWTWERVVRALGSSSDGSGFGSGNEKRKEGVEVTVGVVRG